MNDTKVKLSDYLRRTNEDHHEITLRSIDTDEKVARILKLNSLIQFDYTSGQHAGDTMAQLERVFEFAFELGRASVLTQTNCDDSSNNNRKDNTSYDITK